MIKIAITGGVASGKSEAIDFIKSLSYSAISSDSIVHELLTKDSKVIKQVESIFRGATKNGIIDRSALGRIVFTNPDAMSKLETILHPIVKLVREAFFQKVEQKGQKIAFCEIPLLFERNLQKEFDLSILIVSPLETRLQRFLTRGNGDKKKFFDIVKNQMLDIQKKSLANFIINNNKSVDYFQKEILNTIDKLTGTL